MKMKEARIEGQPASGPWDNDYDDWQPLLDNILETYQNEPTKDFMEMMEKMSSEDHAGVYHRIQFLSGMDPMHGISRDDPKYVPWRERQLKDRDLHGFGIMLRRMMDNDTHQVRREMTEPPLPRATKSGKQFDNFEHYFRTDVAPDYTGGDESYVLAKYLQTAPSTNPVPPLKEGEDTALDSASSQLEDAITQNKDPEEIAAAADALSAVAKSEAEKENS